MFQRLIARLFLAAGILLLASTVLAVPPDELQPPVFVNCQDGPYKHVSHCDDSAFHQFEAYLPHQPLARGRMRYRLVEGPGQINEKTGLWVWHPDEGPVINRACPLIVAASINGGRPGAIVETQCSGRLYYSDDWRPRLVWGVPHIGVHQGAPIFRIDNPGSNVIPISLTDIDSCDHPVVRILQVTPALDGGIYFSADTALIVELTDADLGGKYGVRYEITSGALVDTSDFYFDTRGPVVPVFGDCPQDTLSVPVGGRLDVFLRAEDPDFPEQPEGIWYRLESSPDEYHGHVITYNGHYFYHPMAEHAGEIFPVEISAHYADTGTTGDQNCRFWVKVIENHPPQFIEAPCGDSVDTPIGEWWYGRVDGFDPDGDSVLYYMNIDPQPAGDFGWSYNEYYRTRSVFFVPDSADSGKAFTMTLIASDGIDSTTCSVFLSVQPRQATQIAISHLANVYQGAFTDIDITVESSTEPLRGFDLLISFNPVVLTLQDVTEGTIFDECEWEYFTYRYNVPCPFDSGCPPRLLRIVGIAETNNGDVHPSCFDADQPFTLATLDFLITNDRTYDCTWEPIRFWWLDCGNNVISFGHSTDPDPYSHELALSQSVFDPDSADQLHPYVEITSSEGGFPRITGAPNSCLADGIPSESDPIRLIDFYNGGIDIICVESVDTRGDLNLNGIAYEIADAVVYRDYFIHGRRIFVDSLRQTATSDVNRDNIPLTVQDFVYLARVIVGDAGPYQEVLGDTAEAEFSVDNWAVYVFPEMPLGAVFMTFDGEVTPTLHADDMEIGSAYDQDADLTRCLVYSLSGNAKIDSGQLTSLDHLASVVQFDAATYEGSPVHEIELIPTDARGDTPPLPIAFALYQNHPNPFNLETVIPFDLPTSGEVTFEIFNALGQSVYRRRTLYPAGSHRLTWDGRTDDGAVASSGIYYYCVSSHDITRTRKMVLLK